jgi:hypothetical protein
MLSVMLAYVSAGIAAEVPRNAESLCSFVRSTLRPVALSGIFAVVPVEDVSVIVFISTMKDRRFVLGGGVSGAAVKVKLTVAVFAPPPPPPVEVLAPLQEIRNIDDNEDSAARIFRKFISPHGKPVPTFRRVNPSAFQVRVYAQALGNRCKTTAVCSSAKCIFLERTERAGEKAPGPF